LSDDNEYREEWREAINKEMGTIIGMEVFEYISPAEEANRVRAFKSRWVFKVKIEADGIITFKARLVVKGYSQKYGFNYDEMYAPTMTFGTILMIPLTNRDLYMELPEDYTGLDADGNIRRVIVRLKKNLYGSKQAALMWYSLISEVLCNRGFKRSRYEPCCFILEPNGCIDDSYVIVSVYVDDLLITGPNVQVVESIKQYISESFKRIKDLKEVKKYLGLKIQRGNNQILLNQEDYIDDIVIEFGKSRTINSRTTPLPRDLGSLKEDQRERINRIQDMLGKIRYLADRTRRPDIMFPASFLARFAASFGCNVPSIWILEKY
jgi:hypothetical protein